MCFAKNAGKFAFHYYLKFKNSETIVTQSFSRLFDPVKYITSFWFQFSRNTMDVPVFREQIFEENLQFLHKSWKNNTSL